MGVISFKIRRKCSVIDGYKRFIPLVQGERAVDATDGGLVDGREVEARGIAFPPQGPALQGVARSRRVQDQEGISRCGIKD